MLSIGSVLSRLAYSHLRLPRTHRIQRLHIVIRLPQKTRHSNPVCSQCECVQHFIFSSISFLSFFISIDAQSRSACSMRQCVRVWICYIQPAHLLRISCMALFISWCLTASVFRIRLYMLVRLGGARISPFILNLPHDEHDEINANDDDDDDGTVRIHISRAGENATYKRILSFYVPTHAFEKSSAFCWSHSLLFGWWRWCWWCRWWCRDDQNIPKPAN